jgi:hypothetical protein
LKRWAILARAFGTGPLKFAQNWSVVLPLVAWPAEWGSAGVMAFIVNQQGKIYQKNLGPKAAALAEAMTRYEPDSGWSLVKGQ